jgi:hypothetical protein
VDHIAQRQESKVLVNSYDYLDRADEIVGNEIPRRNPQEYE